MKTRLIIFVVICLVLMGYSVYVFMQEPVAPTSNTILKSDGTNEPVKPVFTVTVKKKVKHPARAIFCETDLEAPCWYNDKWGRKESKTSYKWYDSDVTMWRDAR